MAIVLDNSVQPGVVVSMAIDEDKVEDFVAKYQLATNKRFEVEFIDGENGGVVSLTTPVATFVPSFPSTFVAPSPELLPVAVEEGTTKSPEVLALEAEARSKNPNIGLALSDSSQE